jgi:esterase/lipase superfamily enzyme
MPPGGAMMKRNSAWALLVGLAAMLCLSACAGRPQGVLMPVTAVAEGTSRVDMLVATTRMKSESPGEMFSGERGRTPMFAEISVSIPPDSRRKIGDVQWPASLPGNPATDFVTVAANSLTLEEARGRFHKMIAASPHRHVLIFVHGFNNRFDDAVFRFAQITHDSHVPAVPVLFTWPSRGSLWAYGYDRESTNYSRDALETLLKALDRDPAVGEISVLAHSMGNWLTLEALRQMAIRDKRVSRKIKAVMLAAPDVDVDVFRQQILAIGTTGPKFTLFVSQDDRALAFSRRVWGDVARLGAIDPTVDPYKTELAADKITVIDLTKLSTDDRLNHAKFAESPQVVQLIGSRLASGQPVTDSHVGLGDRIAGVAAGAASTVGSAAGLVLSAPIAIVDPATRANLGGRVGEIGGGISDTTSAAP